MRPSCFNCPPRDLQKFAFATLALLFYVVSMALWTPSPQVSTRVSEVVESVAPYGVQGMIPWYLDSAGKSRLDTTAKLGANQYYLYPYGAMYHKGFLYSQLQATDTESVRLWLREDLALPRPTGERTRERGFASEHVATNIMGTQWYYFHARHYDSAYGRFIGHDLVAPDLNNPLTLNPFLYCLNNPGRWVDPDGRDFEFWSFESAFDFAFQTDFGESGQTFVDKAPDRISKVPGFLATKGVESGGDMVQAVPSSVYSSGAFLTIGTPISPVFTTLGLTKNYLDYSEATSSETKQQALTNLRVNVMLTVIGAFSPAALGKAANIPIDTKSVIIMDSVRSIPGLSMDLFFDLKNLNNRNEVKK
jgi:RHS repeat-associated protein